MKMRVGVLWSAAALALLTVSSALRQQGDGVSQSRKLPAQAPDSNRFSTDSPEGVTYRSRSNRRREEPPRDVTPRSRTRSRPDTKERTEPERPSGNNERFDSRRTRTRKPIEALRPESTVETIKNTAIKSRSRQTVRRPTQSPELSSRTIEEKIDAFNTNVDEISKHATKQDTATQFSRRSSIVQTTENVVPKRGRGRINTRPSARVLDLEDSGSTNSILIVEKAPTTVRTSADLRNARKLRYKTRPSETDSNLTGEGTVALNEVKSSQIENITSQPEIQTAGPISMERIVQQSTEANKPSTTIKVTRVVRRPLGRGKATHAPFVVTPKKKSDDISEDDNYPESFKALIQAKNATQASSPTRESLSVKASQKVFKTYSTSSQSTQMSPAENKYSRLRSKQKAEELNKLENGEESAATTATPEMTSQSSEYKIRGKYSIRNKKSTTFSPGATTASSIIENTEKPDSKYSRKFKFTRTTHAPKIENNDRSKIIEPTSGLKKPVIRPSFYSRKLAKSTVTSTEVSVTISENKEETVVRKKVSLPRTSYYSRLRNRTETTTTKVPAKEEADEVAQNKTDTADDMPLIFTLYNNSENKELVSDSLKKDETEIVDEPFIISISSTESQENLLANEVTSNMAVNSEDKPVVSPTIVTKLDTDRQKYHANFKNVNRNVIDANTRASSTVPSVRNLQRRRQRTRQKDKIEDSSDTTTVRSRDRNVRKFSEAFSKTTETSNNGIIAETEKSKSRFSSKYRASYLNKPFYKPTVPTITSSTVEGEEIQLGPDNAIAITQTRRTLSSADLRLSESLLKSSQVMNVEASHHSPSVTVSIFDALADILTSTPKTRLSSTTEVTTKPNLNTDVTQILNGVSNIVNVNSSGGITSPDLFVPGNASSTATQSVQNTVQTTPNVINIMSAGGSVTPSLNTEVVTPVNTPQTPIPIPTTSVSARRPFAIKVLYSDTESPSDKTTTAPDFKSNQPTTDNPTMVYNTVSDLLLSNKNLVSSELTSMLSNNIRSIIQNMDEDSRSRISVDMANLLKSLIPRAIDGLATVLDNADSVPNTTPYSLEDIKDTENIDVNTNLNSFDILQSVTTDNSVYSKVENSNPVTSSVVVTDNPAQPVNNINVTQGVTQNTPLGSTSQTTSADLPVTVKTESRTGFETLSSTMASISSSSLSTEAVTSSVLPDTEIENVNNRMNSTSINNTIIPLPFLSNFQVNDFTPSDVEVTNLTKPLHMGQEILEPSQGNFEYNMQDPSQVSPLQLWVLSKKASVLKMIEDLIRQHNTELATAPTFTDIISPSKNNINLSERLTNIMNTMTFTTQSSTVTTSNDLTITSTSTSNPLPFSTTVQTSPPDSTTSGKSDDGSSTANTPGLPTQDGLQTTTETSSDLSLRFGSNTNNGSTDSTTTTENATRNTLMVTTEQMNNQDSNTESSLSTTASTVTTTTIQENAETTVASANTETTTQLNVETTTQVGVEITTQTDTETTTDGNVGSNQNTTPASVFRAATPIIHKKDYVIFGILPNNTVVRKDPNDDPLESLTEASPYIVYGLLPNNTVIRKFPNGTRVPRIMQKIDILPISPWSLRNPYSPIHNIPAIVRPQSNPIRVSTNTVTSTDITNNGTDTVNNLQKMTKQIRTERPSDGNGNTVFKFIPINEVMVNQQDSNVLKLATKAPLTSNTDKAEVQIEAVTMVTEVNTQASQTQASTTAPETTMVTNTPVATTESTTVPQATEAITMALTTTQVPATTLAQTTTQVTTTTQAPTTRTTTLLAPTTTQATSTQAPTTTQVPATAQMPTTTSQAPTTTTQAARTTIQTTNFDDEIRKFQDTQNVDSRNPKYLNVQSFNNILTGAASGTTTRVAPTTPQQNDPTALLQALLSATGNKNTGTLSIPNLGGNIRVTTKAQTTTYRSIEDDIRQFEEDTKLLKALLAATGQNPTNLNIPSLDAILTTTRAPKIQPPTTARPTTTTTRPTTTTVKPTTTSRPTTTTTQITSTQSLQDDLKQFQEDTKLLQALLQATGQNTGNIDIPNISRVTSNVRIASNPQTTQIGSNPTTPLNVRPVFTTTNDPVFRTLAPRPISTTPSVFTTEDVRISTTFTPFTQRQPITTQNVETGTLSGRQAPSRFIVTTDIPSSSTFSVQEDLAFLQNLKSVLNTNTGSEDPETALANRIISLAVEKSLTEIQTGNSNSGVRTGKTIANSTNNLIPVTTSTTPTTSTTQATTTRATTQRTFTTTTVPGGLSIEDDIKQFQEDTKLLQALIKATGQDPSNFNIPTLPNLTPTGAQETTTFRSKLALTGQTSDEALKKLIQQQKATGMVSEATKSPISLSTEYGKSNDALLAALLKEQGFGPTTASSIDEQLRLAALLNQVVVTPKARRTTTPPPPPPAPRRPVLDGLAWLWQQWRETGPGPAPSARPSPQRPGPAPSVRPSEATSNRVNWFGSGPFTGNADDRPASSNRVGFSSLLLKLCDWG